MFSGKVRAVVEGGFALHCEVGKVTIIRQGCTAGCLAAKISGIVKTSFGPHGMVITYQVTIGREAPGGPIVANVSAKCETAQIATARYFGKCAMGTGLQNAAHGVACIIIAGIEFAVGGKGHEIECRELTGCGCTPKEATFVG